MNLKSYLEERAVSFDSLHRTDNFFCLEVGFSNFALSCMAGRWHFTSQQAGLSSEALRCL